jgi:hypothetical protein
MPKQQDRNGEQKDIKEKIKIFKSNANDFKGLLA